MHTLRSKLTQALFGFSFTTESKVLLPDAVSALPFLFFLKKILISQLRIAAKKEALFLHAWL